MSPADYFRPLQNSGNTASWCVMSSTLNRHGSWLGRFSWFRKDLEAYKSILRLCDPKLLPRTSFPGLNSVYLSFSRPILTSVAYIVENKTMKYIRLSVMLGLLDCQ